MSLTARAAADAFGARFGRAPAVVARAPGRVNLIGEHTDYNGGLVLPVAIERATWVAVGARDDGAVHAAALDFGEEDGFPIAAIAPAEQGGWRNYVRGTIRETLAAGVALAGVDLLVTGDVPKGAGLSSSASLEVAIATAMVALAGEERPAIEIARLAQRAENEFVGVRCGILDQLASAACQAGSALLIDCLDNHVAPLPLPPGLALLIVQSGVRRGLVEGAYNQRRAECEEAAAAMGVALLRHADRAMLEAARGRMSAAAARRARHVIGENERTARFAEALRAGDLKAIATLMRAAHASMRDDFEASAPAVDQLVALLDRAIDDRGGARITGGGFGGAAIALVEAERLPTVIEAVRRDYRTPAGAPAEILVTGAAPGASLERP